MRQTSVQTYSQIQANGLLSRMRWLVYDYLFRHGPATSREIDDGMRSPGEVRPSYHKRLSELERLGVACVVGEKVDSTGHTAVLWDVTSALPAGVIAPSRSWREVALALQKIITTTADYMEGCAEMPSEAQVLRQRLEDAWR